MDKIQPGPFRATKLWNMVATSFRQIPVGPHWKNMRKYEDSFTGLEAVDWMMEYLKRNPNFGEEKGTRTICIKMCDRLLQHGAFEAVRAPVGSQPAKFKEDSQLYRFPLKFVPGSADKAFLRPLSSLNGKALPSSSQTAAQAKLTADEVWLDELRQHLARLLRLESPADLDITMMSSSSATNSNVINGGNRQAPGIDVSNVTSNVTRNHPHHPPSTGNEASTADLFPVFVFNAIKALENWPNPPAGLGIPDSPGFERCLLFVVEGFLRGLSPTAAAVGLVGSATNELLRKVFELLSPPLIRRHSSHLDSSSSVESFMQEILNGNAARRGSYPDVCLETAFAGTVPETRLIRKRPRSNSLFPTMDFMTVNSHNHNSSSPGSSRSGSAECIVAKTRASASDAGSAGGGCFPPSPRQSLTTAAAVHAATTPGGSNPPLIDSGSGSLEKINPGYRDDSYDLDDQFFTPQGKFHPEIDWRELQMSPPTYSPDLIRSVQLVLLTETPHRRAQLERLLLMFEKIFKNNQLHFSEEFTTQDFVTQCFAPLVFGDSDPICCHMLLFMVLNRVAIFLPVDDFRAKVAQRMKSLGVVSAFCNRISKNEYDEQRSFQDGHMTELLNGIVANSTMNIKEKRKKLKQFQKSYPDIYAARFENSKSVESIFVACQQEKPKARLTKFKSLRI
ncbi:hypothetical protein BV898_17905 [Hypsibius exemplaris]|uniref:DEP domain-containing protein n=1 Tax=Hypsibius exemplaris TaxID=2072580 RepID=A0A9X6NGE2_HYPEX|nr:hypothetical protein BV898_17905 [Hypsibius exemplaris]